MCTVTFIPVTHGVCFTSNRDEQAGRVPADFPALHQVNGELVLFPKDQQAGGTWMAVHASGNVAVLLNGAQRRHHYSPPYAKSRGLIVLDLISQKSPVQGFEEMEFSGIEPFSIILFEDNKLYVGFWDGTKKILEKRSIHQSHIWSSVTLYDPAAVAKGAGWFQKWRSDNPQPDQASILHFHEFGGEGNSHNDLRMNRDEKLLTQSISSAWITKESVIFRYQDLRTGKSSEQLMPVQKAIAVKS